MPSAALTIAIACYMAYWRIRFRNCRIQNSDERLVFEERKFFHITPVLRAPPPHFYTFDAPSPPLPHFYLFPPPTPHFYCFPFNTTFTTFHCPHPPTHTHYQHISNVFHPPPPPQLFSLHHHLHHISFVFPAPPPPPQFYCFPSTTSTHVFLLFSLHYLHHHLISICFHPQPTTHFYGFSSA